MQHQISYGRAAIGSQATGSSVTTSEETLLTITDPMFLDKSQLSVYVSQALGSATSVEYGVYFSFDNGSTWYKTSVEDLTTNKGELDDIPAYVDSNSPSQSISGTTYYRTVINVPIPAALMLKVTGTAVGGAAGAYILTALFRNN